MKFSFFMMPLHLPSENPALAFDRDIDLINYAEELDFDEFYIGEHHTAGWETMPSPEMILAKASATTARAAPRPAAEIPAGWGEKKQSGNASSHRELFTSNGLLSLRGNQ